ncbi:hypothetical protein E2C01_082617 [Portunus trituberculatus]|uniref:Uncharacterized protein n=1 Tax=Portunus trituberculatus TaxID=210409 RepID=A0A5B7IZR9_PORTR|nr:hypothetical protein [Portunus trituberculatus]
MVSADLPTPPSPTTTNLKVGSLSDGGLDMKNLPHSVAIWCVRLEGDSVQPREEVRQVRQVRQVTCAVWSGNPLVGTPLALALVHLKGLLLCSHCLECLCHTHNERQTNINKTATIH